MSARMTCRSRSSRSFRTCLTMPSSASGTRMTRAHHRACPADAHEPGPVRDQGPGRSAGVEKTISGDSGKGSTSRWNRIREPSVLFRTNRPSGLSEPGFGEHHGPAQELAPQGRLVFVAIHQPSSDIFKIFDRLLLMDQEGHPSTTAIPWRRWFISSRSLVRWRPRPVSVRRAAHVNS